MPLHFDILIVFSPPDFGILAISHTTHVAKIPYSRISLLAVIIFRQIYINGNARQAILPGIV